MLRKIGLIVSLVALSLMAALPAYAAGPNFQAGLWADGEQWGTKVTTRLPAPKKNGHSYDAFYFITPEGWTPGDAWLQPPVMEAAPGNPAYNGGRWNTIRVTIKAVPDTDGVDLPLTSYAEIMQEAAEGDLTVDLNASWDGVHGSAADPWLNFSCPLLPFK